VSDFSENKKALNRFFDDWFFDESNLKRRKLVQEWWQSAYDILYDHVRSVPNPSRILFLGCGLGTDLDLSEIKGLKSKVIFSDFNLKGLARGREIITGKTEMLPGFVCADMENPCFRKGSIQIIIIINALMCTDKEKVFQACFQMLGPEGKLVFIEPLKHHPLIFIYRMLEKRYRRIRFSCLESKDIKCIEKDWNIVFEKDFFLFSPVVFLLYKKFPFFILKKLLDNFVKWDMFLLRRLPALRKFGALGVYVLGKKQSV